jgi:hypothetical protein
MARVRGQSERIQAIAGDVVLDREGHRGGPPAHVPGRDEPTEPGLPALGQRALAPPARIDPMQVQPRGRQAVAVAGELDRRALQDAVAREAGHPELDERHLAVMTLVGGDQPVVVAVAQVGRPGRGVGVRNVAAGCDPMLHPDHQTAVRLGLVKIC